MTPNMVTHIGWKAIAKRLGRSDIKSTRRAVKKSHIPIYWLGRSPVLDEAIFRVWVAENVAQRTRLADGDTVGATGR